MKSGNALISVFIYVILKANTRCLGQGLLLLTAVTTLVSPCLLSPLQGGGEPDRSYVCAKGVSYKKEEDVHHC